MKKKQNHTYSCNAPQTFRRRFFLAGGVILLLFLIPTPALALLSFSDTSNSYDVLVGIDVPYSATINNSFNFPIYNVTFTPTNSLTIPVISYLPANYSLSFNFTVHAINLVDEVESSLVSFDYLLDSVYVPVNYSVTVTDDVISNPNVSINAGDTVLFTNLNTTKNITIMGGSEEWMRIPYGSVIGKKFNTVGNFDYRIDPQGLLGEVTVKEITGGQQLTHNPTFDSLFSVRVKSSFNASGFKTNFLTDYFSVNYSQQSNGALFVEVLPDSDVLRDVKVTSDSGWIVFDESEASVIVDNKVFGYRMKPLVNSSNATGKNYTITITVSASNAPSQTGEIVVHVLETDEFDPAAAVLPPNLLLCTELQIKALCKASPESCPHTYITKIKEVNVTTNTSVSLLELKSLMKRNYNQYSGLGDDLHDCLAKVEGNRLLLKKTEAGIVECNDRIGKMDDSDRALKNFIIGLIVTIIVLVLAYFGYKYALEWMRRMRHS